MLREIEKVSGESKLPFGLPLLQELGEVRLEQGRVPLQRFSITETFVSIATTLLPASATRAAVMHPRCHNPKTEILIFAALVSTYFGLTTQVSAERFP